MMEKYLLEYNVTISLVTLVSSILSIITFIITIYIKRNITDIKANFIAKNRLPKILKQLIIIRNELPNLIQDLDALEINSIEYNFKREEILEKISLSRSKVESAKNKMSKQQVSKAVELLDKSKKYREMDTGDLWNYKDLLANMVNHLEEYCVDLKEGVYE